MMCKSIKVAKYLIDFQSKEANLCMSHLKLQKLLFYIQAFHLAITNKELFNEEIEAWQYGPVEPIVYEEYKIYGNSVIAPEEKKEENESILPSDVSPESYGVISSVLNAYGHLSAIRLMEKTHREDPWKNAYKQKTGTIIQKEAMRTYYKSFLKT